MDMQKLNKILSWIVTIIALSAVWPVGLFLLFRLLKQGYLIPPEKLTQLTNQSERPYETSAREVYDIPEPVARERSGGARPEPRETRERAPSQRRRETEPWEERERGRKTERQGEAERGREKRKTLKKHWGRGLRVAGWIVSALGAMGTIAELDSRAGGFAGLSFVLGLLATGLVLLGFGFSKKKKARRYRRYLGLIGTRENVSIDSLAEAIPVSYEKACSDLQDMIDEGFLPAAGRVDRKLRRLILGGGLEDMPAAGRAVDERDKSERSVLAEIREVNDRIPDPVMSAKIDRIEEITGRILDYKSRNPDSAGDLESFLNYYLPTTLKLLRSYARMDEQGVEGRNIHEAKASIEATMDKVVEGFEKRLDKLFRTDAIDITSDIQVLEQMLQRDGLAGDELFTLDL